MTNEKLKIIYEDENILVIDKSSGVNCDDFPLRIHRLDKDTSGIFLVAKNQKALEFFQKQFKEREVEKKYTALIVGHLKNEEGVGDETKVSSSPKRASAKLKEENEVLFASNARVIKTLLGRSPADGRKQKVYLPNQPGSEGKREAVTKYKLLQRFADYDLIEAEPKTGRKHQIRAHLAYLNHPISGDKLYGFKNQPCPQGLKRQFLHASYLKIILPDGTEKEFNSKLPDELNKIIINLEIRN
ncbi:MAG: RluA family pseudouridine synthase [bacterium]|nr:RluA family pseudouridine synthase [bacterium]